MCFLFMATGIPRFFAPGQWTPTDTAGVSRHTPSSPSARASPFPPLRPSTWPSSPADSLPASVSHLLTGVTATAVHPHSCCCAVISTCVALYTEV